MISRDDERDDGDDDGDNDVDDMDDEDADYGDTEGDHEYDDNVDGVAATTAPSKGRLGEVPVDRKANGPACSGCCNFWKLRNRFSPVGLAQAELTSNSWKINVCESEILSDAYLKFAQQKVLRMQLNVHPMQATNKDERGNPR